MLKSTRIILAIAAYFDYEIWQMDVKTTFLNGNLTKDVVDVKSAPHAKHTARRKKVASHA
jgi:hypothetical protein